MKCLRKKVFAVIFTLCVAAMSFIYFTNDMNETVASENENVISENVLSVKCQVSENTTTQTSKLRIVSTIDNLESYKMAGFEITYKGETIPYDTTKAYQSIEAVSGGVDYDYSPNIFDIDSKYFITVTLINIVADDYDEGILIKPYVIPVGENARVYGTPRYVSVADAKDNTVLNLPVKMTASNGATYTVKSGDTTYNLETNNSFYNDGTYTHFRIDTDRTKLKSVTTFTVSDGTNTYTAKYRNLNNAYDGTDASKDTTWYDADSDYNVIVTSADLYGFATLVNGGNKFIGKTVYLGADVMLNTGSSSDWNAGIDTSAYAWTQIGNSTSKYFAGTFNGQMHTVSGIYVNNKSANVGLFGVTSINTKIQNLVVANSYIKADRAVGVIAGQGGGVFESIHVKEDVYVTSAVLSAATTKGRWCGGIIGVLCPVVSGETVTTDKPNTIKNCWFAGTLCAGRYGGGMTGSIGKHDDAADTRTTTIARIEHCLNTGSITHTGITTTDTTARTGGLCGAVVAQNSSTYSTITITDSLNIGTVTSQISGGKFYGGIYGHGYGSSNITFENVYAASDSCDKNGSSTGTVSGKIDKSLQTAVMKGYGAYSLNLDYTNYWVARNDATPALASLVDSAIRTIPSTTWHDEADSEETDGTKVYTINTVADLYGFSKLSAEGVSFAGEKIQLGADIKLNKGLAASWAKYAPDNEWVPIGKETPFEGTFDGQGHTISGLYASSESSSNIGLFAKTNTSAVIQNVTIKNTYFKGKSAIGAIAGEGGGTFRTIHIGSDVYLENTVDWCGGIIGLINADSVTNGTASETHTIENCWFEGTIRTVQHGGGMTGSVGKFENEGTESATRYATNTLIKNCLNTGTIIHTTKVKNARAGGLVGAVVSNYDDTANNATLISELTIEDSLCAGKVYSERNDATFMGSVVGHIFNGSKITCIDVYATRECNEMAYNAVREKVDLINDATVTKHLEEQLKGFSGYVNTPGFSYANQYLENAESGKWVAVQNNHPVLKSFADGYTAVDFSPFVLDGDTVITTMTDQGGGNATITRSGNYYDAYIAKIAGENGLGFTQCYSESVGSGNETVNVSSYKKDDLVITVTYVKGTNTTYISAGTNVGLSEYLTDKVSGNTTNGTMSLSMLELEKDSGSSYVIQLENGHFIIEDGGETENDYNNLVTYLNGLTQNEKPIIDAWIISHAHGDHFGLLKNVTTGDALIVEGFYYTQASGDSSDAAIIRNRAKLFQTISGDTTEVYRMYTGQKYYFDGVTMEVLLTHEQLTGYTDFNETSVWCKYTIGSGDATKVFLNGADSSTIGMKFMMNAYSADYLYSDFFAALHHGVNILDAFKEHLVSNAKEPGCVAEYAILYSRKSDPEVKDKYLTSVETSDLYDEATKIVRRELIYQYNLELNNAVKTGIGENDFFYYGAGTVRFDFTSTGIAGGYIGATE